MTGNKKVSCKVCYREMRSDVLARHMKQHSKRNESNPVTNISVTKNYNTTSSVLADREDEVECEAQTTIDEKALEIAALKINKEYEEEVKLGKALYKILNKGVVQEESFPPEWQRVHFYTAPSLSWSAGLKYSGAKLEIPHDISMHIFIDNGLRGGISMVANQYAKANNLEMKEQYDAEVKTSYIFFTDANNLYGWAD
jgi:hypothetical protein